VCSPSPKSSLKVYLLDIYGAGTREKHQSDYGGHNEVKELTNRSGMVEKPRHWSWTGLEAHGLIQGHIVQGAHGAALASLTNVECFGV
jgi:hypothetical protein